MVGGNPLISIGMKDLITDDVGYANAQPINQSTGLSDHRADARYHRVLQIVLTPESVAQYSGFDAEWVPTGVR